MILAGAKREKRRECLSSISFTVKQEVAALRKSQNERHLPGAIVAPESRPFMTLFLFRLFVEIVPVFVFSSPYLCPPCLSLSFVCCRRQQRRRRKRSLSKKEL